MFSLNIRGRLHSYTRPLVMGVVNVTPDSFYAESRTAAANVEARVLAMASQGADIIDIGACSTRPGSQPPTMQEEIERLIPAIEVARRAVPDAVISADTYRSEVARRAVEAGADIINDATGGIGDPVMAATIAELRVPYVLTHTPDMPERMQQACEYRRGVVCEVMETLCARLAQLRQLGVADVIIDPGFGFGKTLEQNYELLASLRLFKIIGAPLLVGLSRKSMLTSLLDITSEQSLAATVAATTEALMRGADIVRVHDPAAAAQAIAIHLACQTHQEPCI